MWISSNATTAMMLPILEAVLSELEQEHGPNKEEEAISSDTLDVKEPTPGVKMKKNNDIAFEISE